jgi:membrane protein implicated in regulation of membrane protease activity
VKDVVFYPFVRTAYESGVRTGAERLIGARGVAREALAPRGYVHVKGELWCAEAEAPEASIPPGSRVRVRGTRGLTLIVAEDGDDERRGARWSNAS